MASTPYLEGVRNDTVHVITPNEQKDLYSMTTSQILGINISKEIVVTEMAATKWSETRETVK